MRGAIVLALLAAAIFVAASGWLAMYPGVIADFGGAPDLDRIAERVRIPVGEGDRLDGWLLRGARPGVIVMFHGYARDHRRMWRYAQFLRRDGWTLLAVDFRSSRARDRKPTTLGFWELLDARATLDWVTGRPELAHQRVGLFAESLGGAVALVLAAERPSVAALAVDSPFANGRMALEDGCTNVEHVPAWLGAPPARWLGMLATGHDPTTLDAAAAARALRGRPLLLIQSGVADRFGSRQVALLEDAAGPEAQKWIVPGAGHNQGWATARAAYEARVGAFFRAHLRAPEPVPARVPARRATRAGAGAAHR